MNAKDKAAFERIKTEGFAGIERDELDNGRIDVLRESTLR